MPPTVQPWQLAAKRYSGFILVLGSSFTLIFPLSLYLMYSYGFVKIGLVVTWMENIMEPASVIYAEFSLLQLSPSPLTGKDNILAPGFKRLSSIIIWSRVALSAENGRREASDRRYGFKAGCGLAQVNLESQHQAAKKFIVSPIEYMEGREG